MTLILQALKGMTHNVRAAPGLQGAITGKVVGPARLNAKTTPQAVAFADGYRWRELEQGGWVADAAVTRQNAVSAVKLPIVDFINDAPAPPSSAPFELSEIEYFEGERFGWYVVNIAAPLMRVQIHFMHEEGQGRLEVGILPGDKTMVKSVDYTEVLV